MPSHTTGRCQACSSATLESTATASSTPQKRARRIGSRAVEGHGEDLGVEPLQRFKKAARVLVGQYADNQGQGARCPRLALGQGYGQGLSGMGIVPHIQQQVQTLALPLDLPTIQTAGHPGPLQSYTDQLRLPGQPGKQVGLQRQRRETATYFAHPEVP